MVSKKILSIRMDMLSFVGDENSSSYIVLSTFTSGRLTGIVLRICLRTVFHDRTNAGEDRLSIKKKRNTIVISDTDSFWACVSGRRNDFLWYKIKDS